MKEDSKNTYVTPEQADTYTETSAVKYGVTERMLKKDDLDILYVRIPSGSRKGKTHLLTIVNQKAVACTCEGFFHRQSCSHMTFWEEALRDASRFVRRDV